MGCPKLKENFTFLKALHSKKGESLKKNDLDYYSFGMPMPNRNIEGQYRYAYQGQEKDPETGMEAFELRLWDGRIGRWLTTDPYGQHFSPYMGMGNNPIRLIDPDGGWTEDWIYNPDTDSYYWDGNVTFDDRSAMAAGHQYVGVGQTDIASHFNDNNNWFTTTLSSPDINTSSFTDYLSSELNSKVENFITTQTPQRIDDIRGFYENFNLFGSGINWGRFSFNLDMNINGTRVNNGTGNVKIFKNKNLNIFDYIEFDLRTWNGEVNTAMTYPYQIQLHSSRIQGGNPQPTIHLLIHRNQGSGYNAINSAWYGN